MQPLQADLAGAPRGGLEGQGPDLGGRQQPMGVEQTQDLELPGSHTDPHHEVGNHQGHRAWRSRRGCQGLDPTGIDNLRLGDARGRGHGAVAGVARARTLWESTARGLVMPGGIGMAQSLELRGLGPCGN